MVDASRSQPTRILIVDDHATVRHGLAQLISYEPDLEVCGEAESVSEAITVTEKTHPDVSLIDISLGEDSGFELIRMMKALDNPLKMIVVSVHDEARFVDVARQAGAVGFVSKQQAPSDIVYAIRCVLTGRTYFTGERDARK